MNTPSFREVVSCVCCEGNRKDRTETCKIVDRRLVDKSLLPTKQHVELVGEITWTLVSL